MTEILTESFCERCGTRYTFESTAPRQKRMGGIRVLGRGLKNFVLSDDSSLDEAMAAARSDVEREATTQQLDAFHRTFNFCMSCRQYTCGNCWNDVEARCLSCAPLPEAEIVAAELAAPPAEVDLERLFRLTAPAAEAAWPAEATPGVEVAPEAEVELVGTGEVAAKPELAGTGEVAAEAELAGTGEPERIGEVEVVAHAGVEPVAPEPVEAADREVAEGPVVVGTDGAAPGALPDWAAPRRPTEEPVVELPLAAAQAPAPDEAPAIEAPAAADVATGEAATRVAAAAEAALRGLEPGESLDDAIAAYEASQAEVVQAEAVAAEGVAGGGPGVDVVEQPTWPYAPVAAEPEAEPVAAAPEPKAEPEPVAAEPVAAAPQPSPEPVPIAAAAPVVPRPEPEAPAAAPAEPLVPPMPPAAPAPPVGAPTGPPQWPTGPRWPTGIPARPTVPPPPPGPVADPLTAIMARQATEAMWAASSRDVIQPPLVAQVAPIAGVQPCVSCGISLSANARFCRRCGTAQGG